MDGLSIYMVELPRKIDKIKIVESDSPAMLALNKNSRCMHCKERYYMTEIKGDTNNLLCTNCGQRTPIRSLKQARSLVAPSIQQTTSIVQSKSETETENKRKPKGINRKQSDLEKYLSQRGRQIIQSDTLEA